MSIVGAWADIHYDEIDVLAGELHVMVYGRFAAAGRKSGKKVDLPLVEIWRIEAGLVISVTAVYFDTALIAAVLA